MTRAIVGVRATRNATLMFVKLNGVEVVVGDLVLVELAGSRFLAVVALIADQILAIPALGAPGRVLAATESAEVATAVRARDAAAIELARDELGPDVPVRTATWSADRGRVTLAVDRPTAELPGLVERLEPRYRAEVRCISADARVTLG